MSVQLYSYFRSSASYRVRIALNLKKVSYNYLPIHLLKDGGQNKSKEFSNLNPMQQVPYFIDQDGFSVGQSMAILMYLDKKIPEPDLFRMDKPQQMAKIIEMSEIVNSGIQPLMNLSALNFLRDELMLNDLQRQMWLTFNITKGLKALEEVCANHCGKFMIGDELSAADVFLVPQIFGAKRFHIDLSPYPNLQRINDNCLKVDAFHSAQPHLQIDAEN